MNKEELAEALYASFPDIVVCRKKSVIIPALVFLAGLVMLAAQHSLEKMVDFRVAVITFSVAAIIIGAILSLSRAFGKGEPFHREKKHFLRYETLSFDAAQRKAVLEALENGDGKELRSMARCEVSVISVAVYALPDGSFGGAKAYSYQELEYRPISDLHMIRG